MSKDFCETTLGFDDRFRDMFLYARSSESSKVITPIKNIWKKFNINGDYSEIALTD